MANDIIKLTYAPDGEVDQAELNLLDFVQGITLAEGGWVPQIATGDQATVTETLTFRAKATSHDDFASRITQILDDWKIKIAWSQDYTQRQFVWLNARWKSETNIRRAVVYKLDYSFGNESSPFGVYVRDDSFAPTLTIVIVRGAYWESPDQVLLANSVNINMTGGTDLLEASGIDYVVVGDVPSRIYDTFFLYSASLRYVWAGFRASRNGVLANFVPAWDLFHASYLLATSSDTVVAADATTRNGVSAVFITFASTAALATRVRINVADITANKEDQRGTYVCLMRARIPSGTARARISSGFGNASYSNAYFINPRVTISGSSWFLYNMGILRLPAINRQAGGFNDVMAQAAVIIDAERVTGSSNLVLDCLILIPYNDAYMEFDTGNNSADASVYVNADFTTAAYDSNTIQAASIQQNAWGMPANNEAPLLVLAGQTATAHVLTTTTALSAFVTPRWRTLRGNE